MHFEVYFRKRSIYCSVSLHKFKTFEVYCTTVDRKKPTLPRCILRYILEKGSFYVVHFVIYFRKRSILDQNFAELRKISFYLVDL